MRNAVNHFPHGHFGPPLDFLPIFDVCYDVSVSALMEMLFVYNFFAQFLPLSNLKLRLSQLVYTLSAPCTHTHTLTPMQAVATHYAHTYVFHIFMHLPHGTLSYSLRYPHVRTHTHFQQPITGRQSILNADTEYIARTSKLTDIHSISSNASVDMTATSHHRTLHDMTHRN